MVCHVMSLGFLCRIYHRAMVNMVAVVWFGEIACYDHAGSLSPHLVR